MDVTRFATLGIGPRLGLAVLPTAVAILASDWLPACWFSDSPFCIWYWQPPLADIAFGLLVLAPFLVTPRLWPLRVLGLVVVSVAVHWQAPLSVVGLRGTITLPGVDTIFLNVVPIAVAASLVIAALTVPLAGFRTRPRYWGLACLAGLPPAAVFLAPDLSETVARWIDGVSWLLWPAWHLSLCAAIHFGRVPAGGTGR